MIDFARPWLLILLLFVPLFFLYLQYWKPRARLFFPDSRAFSRAGARRRRLPPAEYAYLAALALLLVALAGPRIGDEKIILRAEGIDIMLVLDLSGSMEAADLPPEITTREDLLRARQEKTLRSRLDTARDELKKFIHARPNDRIGLIGFADYPFLLAPPTLDHGFLAAQLDTLAPGILGDATGIAAPLASGIERLRTSSAPRRVMLLFTDGKNNVQDRATPEQAAALAAKFNVTIHAVGIGGTRALFRNSILEDSFDEPMLRAIAEAGRGHYFHAADAEGMRRVMGEINRMETTSFEQPRHIEYREFAATAALAALAFLFLGFLYETTAGLRLP